MIPFFETALVLVGSGATLIATLRWRTKRRHQRIRRDRAGEDYDTFNASFAADHVEGAVTRVVYEFFAHGSAVASELAPRRMDRLWKDQGVDYPEELADVLTDFFTPLGMPRRVRPSEILELRTVGDVVLWLDRELASVAQPA
jgi:hypothetical protein